MRMSDSSHEKDGGGGATHNYNTHSSQNLQTFCFFAAFLRGNLKFAKSIANPANIVNHYYLGYEAHMSHTVFDKCQPLK